MIKMKKNQSKIFTGIDLNRVWIEYQTYKNLKV